MKKILATLDGSEFSKEILNVLSQLFGPNDAEVILVTVSSSPSSRPAPSQVADFRPSAGAVDAASVSPAANFTPGEPGIMETGEQAIARVVSEDEDMLESVAHVLRQKGLTVTCEVLLDSNPAGAIAGHARQRGVDLIAMATHGRGGIGRLIQGSVAAKVLESGAAPMLLVRPSGV